MDKFQPGIRRGGENFVTKRVKKKKKKRKIGKKNKFNGEGDLVKRRGLGKFSKQLS